MAAIILRLGDPTLDRLDALAEATGATLNEVIERLLDRDPHDHEHRCPTCVRQAERERANSAHLGQDMLFGEAAT